MFQVGQLVTGRHVVRPGLGRRVAVWVFAMILSCSRTLFVQPVRRRVRTGRPGRRRPGTRAARLWMFSNSGPWERSS
ncbi:MAG: hypothetical protein QOC69_1221 [Mycobacterium sp.]|jgi:hypothetical protein|nr:hypothetical protein [Mycobacterium sp.]